MPGLGNYEDYWQGVKRDGWGLKSAEGPGASKELVG